MDKYDVGFQIAKLIAESNEPLCDLKYLKKIMLELWGIYIERENSDFLTISFIGKTW